MHTGMKTLLDAASTPGSIGIVAMRLSHQSAELSGEWFIEEDASNLLRATLGGLTNRCVY